MDKLSPTKSKHKLLISTTSQLVGAYKSDSILITPVFWPSGSASAMSEGPFSRSVYMVVFEAAPDPKNEDIWPDYTLIGDMICIYLSILYGKRFDNHGVVQGGGLFYMPNYPSFQFPSNCSIPQNSRVPRKDIIIPLNLDEIKRIERLINPSLKCERIKRIKPLLLAAGRFYLQALQRVEESPEVAYLDLITAGEIISNYYRKNDEKYSKDKLLDEETKNLINQIKEASEDGPELARKIKDKLFQVKKGFCRVLEDLLTDPFFANSEADRDFLRLQKDDIKERLPAAYDLRSKYVHEGVLFGNLVYSSVSDHYGDIQMKWPVFDKKETEKKEPKEMQAPTYFGLERIIRYCLLRFMHTNGVPIDPKLKDIS
jgi:hypothetical protein